MCVGQDWQAQTELGKERKSTKSELKVRNK